MSEESHPIFKLLRDDPRYMLDAYQFIREALAFAQDVLRLGDEAEGAEERHLTGQELSEAIRLYALEQFGFMAKVVLNSWGLHVTGDFGEVVYNLIGIGLMKKSESDRREDFDDVFDFDTAFQKEFQITPPE